MLYFMLGFSISMNVFLITLYVLMFKKRDFKSKIYEKIDEEKNELDPWETVI